MNLKDKKLFLLDMDGTIYLDDYLFEGTIEFLQKVKEMGGKYIFLTNNSSKSVEKYIEKLDKLGIASTAEDFVTSVNATAENLKAAGYRKIYISGTESFFKQLKDEGLPVTNEICEDIDCLCMGFDTELSFKKLENICILLNKDIAYVASNPDLVCPTAYGFVPDCGSVSQMIKNATGKMPYFIGKPQPDMVYMAMDKTGFSKEETVVVGDRLYTDIACGVNAGIDQIFVLSGEGTVEDIEKYDVHPTYIMKDIKEILENI